MVMQIKTESENRGNERWVFSTASFVWTWTFCIRIVADALLSTPRHCRKHQVGVHGGELLTISRELFALHIPIGNCPSS